MKLFYLFIILTLFSCKAQKSNEMAKNNFSLSTFVDFEKMDKVTMSNNTGTFDLNYEQLEHIKEELAALIYDPNISAKLGAINIALRFDNKVYNVSCATNGDFIEVNRDIIVKNEHLIGSKKWLYFRTNGVNFDNYKKEEK